MSGKDELDAIAKAAAEVVKPVYQDAVQPVAQEVGKALKTVGGVINIALAPVALMVYGFDIIKQNLQEKLEKRLSKTPPEDIVTPQLQLVGPLIERFKYVYDKEDLSDMFINLLASAMDKGSVQKAHPSFVHVISELLPDEAKLIKLIASKETLPKIDIKLRFKATAENPNPGYNYIVSNFTLLGVEAGLTYPDLTSSYLSNLERLNIISCPMGHYESYTDKNLYEPLKQDDFVSAVSEKIKEGGKGEIELQEGIIRVTDFGEMFMEAVLTPGSFVTKG